MLELNTESLLSNTLLCVKMLTFKIIILKEFSGEDSEREM